jgi:hypothetical protein
MIESDTQFEHWSIYEEIAEKYYRQRYFYGEVQGNASLTGGDGAMVPDIQRRSPDPYPTDSSIPSS